MLCINWLQMATQSKQVMLVVGEASGDVHGAQLVRALSDKDHRLRFFGVGGEKLQHAHFEELFNVSQLASMGLLELAGSVRNIWKAYRILSQAMRERKPNLLVLIDFPEFNLRLAKLAKKLGIPVLYYVSPQIWAWRKGRVRQIARWVDRMAVIFPFEASFYQRHAVNATFVGHPLLETVKTDETREETLAKLGLDPQQPVIALLPGSRLAEI